jgi:DnaJ family protein C protein 27
MLKVIELMLEKNSHSHKMSSTPGCAFLLQTFYVSIVDLCENGGKRPTVNSSTSFTREQADTIRRIRSSKDSWDMLGVKPGASR